MTDEARLQRMIDELRRMRGHCAQVQRRAPMWSNGRWRGCGGSERLRWSTVGRVRSLHWDGDELLDWVGGTRWGLDGVQIDPHVQYAYVFDSAVVSPSGRYQALYTECGTKGLILDRGRVVREINRSFYHANHYEYRSPSVACLMDARSSCIVPTTTTGSRSMTWSRAGG